MRIGFGKNSGKFYVVTDSYPNNNAGSNDYITWLIYRYSITMIEHVNNFNANTISHERCLPESIYKIITQKITKTTRHVY